MMALRTIAILVATVFLAATVVPVLAQTPPPGVKSTEPTKATTDKAATDDATAKKAEKTQKTDKTDKTDKKAAKKADKAEKKQAKKDAKESRKHAKKTDTDDTERSNKGGEVRGLDRADQVTGEHGKQGRDKARAKQGR